MSTYRQPSDAHDAVVRVLFDIVEDVLTFTSTEPATDAEEADRRDQIAAAVRLLREAFVPLNGGPAGPGATPTREALVRCLADPSAIGLERLATALTAVLSRPVHARAGPPRHVLLAGAVERGPWLGYVFAPAAATCWLALGWRPASEVNHMRASLLVDGDDHFRAGPIRATIGSPEFLSTVLMSVRYRPGTVPAEHALVNDLHAMVVLHDLLAQDAA